MTIDPAANPRHGHEHQWHSRSSISVSRLSWKFCSAGSSGPSAGTVSNVAPWLFTVGASTLDRQFEAFVELRKRLRLKGTSLSEPLPENRLYPLISGAQAKAANASANGARLCKPGTLDHDKVKGKILACLRGNTSRVDKGMQAKLAGVVGMILCNDEASGNEIIADMHVLPSAHLTYKDGAAVLAYINSSDPWCLRFHYYPRSCFAYQACSIYGGFLFQRSYHHHSRDSQD